MKYVTAKIMPTTPTMTATTTPTITPAWELLDVVGFPVGLVEGAPDAGSWKFVLDADWWPLTGLGT